MNTDVNAVSGIVRPMERGQITIPVNIRKKLEITPDTWLWVRLVKNKIMIEPVEKDSSSSLSNVLLDSTKDPKIYWKKSDIKDLDKVREKSKERIKKLVNG
ncbi:MAG: AbrB/MazE/SpoVT family DNA-binding domain-containing protein [Candidatus Shapirobacteria bacterium]